MVMTVVLSVQAGEVIDPDTASIYVTDAVCNTGDIGKAYVSMHDPNTIIDALVFSLDVSDGITATSVIGEGDHMQWIIFDPTDPDGEVDYAEVDLFGNPIPSGLIATVEFDCDEPGTYAISFSSDPMPSAGGDGQSIPLLLGEATVQVQSNPTAVSIWSFSAHSWSIFDWFREWFNWGN